MTDFHDIETTYFAALEKSPAERPAFLDAACRGNADLRARVDRLLAAQAQAGDFLDPPAGTQTFDPDVPTADFPGAKEHLGAVLAGKYKLIEEIGEGGMGSVFLAQQTEPVKRTVAVKVIKAGMDSKAVLARFEAERQALAMMDHPNISRVLDAGTTESGRPFFVMELVKGVPITEYCDARKLTPRERLELFVPVCHAIQHAHQKGVIHRDIKPSNVLIALYDDKPVPKVIDFGVAKAAGSALTDKTLMTGFGTVVGTPEYMSPEQASLNNLDVDTRSDVYSLGVLLYELLTGTTPVDKKSLGKAALLEVLRVVREVEAPKPSAKLSTAATLPSIAANRGTEPAKLSKLMKGELDWVVLKALEKDRARRYDTANGLARDVQRYLADEIVEARPPSTGYRVRKFVRRHRGQVLAGGVVAAVLVAGVVGTTAGLIEARTQRDAAEAARQKEAEAAAIANYARERATVAERVAREEAAAATAVRKFLQDDLLGKADPVKQAEATRTGGANAPTKSNPTVGELLDRAAASLAPGKIDAKFPNMPFVQAEALKAVGEAYSGVGQDSKALPLFVRAVDLFTQARGPDDPATLAARHGLGVARFYSPERHRAIDLLEPVYRDRVRVLGPCHPDTFDTRIWLTVARAVFKRIPDPIAEFAAIRADANKHLGPGHFHTVHVTGQLVAFLNDLGRAPEAIAVIEELHNASWLGDTRPDHPFVQIGLALLAEAYIKTDRLPEAKRVVADLLAGPENDTKWRTAIQIGYKCMDSGRRAAAAQVFEWVAAAAPADSDRRYDALNGLGHTYRAVGKNAEEVPVREQILAALRKGKPADDPAVLDALEQLGAAYNGAGRRPEGTAVLEELISRLKAARGPEHPQTLKAMQTLCNACSGQKAVDLGGEIVAARRKFGRKDAELANALASFGAGSVTVGKAADGEAALREALEIRTALNPGSWVSAHTKCTLGWALLELKRYPEAETMLVTSYREMAERKAMMPAYHARRPAQAAQYLVRLYTELGKPDEAARWRPLADAKPKETAPPPRPAVK